MGIVEATGQTYEAHQAPPETILIYLKLLN